MINNLMLMKKIIPLFFVFVLALNFADVAKAQISVGVGYANERLIEKLDYVIPDGLKGHSWEKSFADLNGFYVEAAYNLDLVKFKVGELSLQPALRYSLYTRTISATSNNIKQSSGDFTKLSDKRSVTDHVLDIPVNLRYSYKFLNSFKAYVFAGPVFSLGLAFNAVNVADSKSLINGETYKTYDYERTNLYNGGWFTKEWDDNEKKYHKNKGQNSDLKDYSMFDLKLGLGIGVNIAEKVDVKFGYNIGLLNRGVEANDTYQDVVHSNIMYFGVAYNF